ncbi:cytochrome P450 protein [Rutstroemia sp. NJR-2017a WRK4]|nr:cytochrome P450 protein [Rutstroemia sp. NJR-2017a WRK4]
MMTLIFFPLQGTDAFILSTFACILFLLLLWRIYRFTITPWLYPQNPRELPYWIPCESEYIAHWHSYFTCFVLIYHFGRHRVYFGNTKALYSITLAGETICVITGGDDIGELYKNTSTITWENLIKDMYTFVGLSPKSINGMFNEDREQPGLTGFGVPTRSAHEMTSEYHRQQLLSTANHEILLQRLIPGLQENLSWDVLKQHSASERKSQDSITLSLWAWCNEVIINGSTKAYYGPKIFEINPHLLRAIITWEETNWKFFYHLPNLMARDMMDAKNEVIDTLCRYFETPQEERPGMLHFVTAMEAEMRSSGLSNRETAGIHMLHLWAITGNVYKAAFWIIAYLVHDQSLLARIREEVAPAVKGESVNLNHLTENCPRLESLFNEVLRVNSAGALAREVIAPTLFAGKMLRKGTKLMIPYRQLHLDDDAWGPSTHDFDPERFLRDKSLTRSHNYRPFGGGSTLCPGRFLARKAIYTIVAVLFCRYDVTLDQGGVNQKFPRLDDTTAGIGTMAPMHGYDVKLVVKPKEI